ncbi:MAG: hypothetical protein WD066_08320 [Planctomycetaceae bacterium]
MTALPPSFAWLEKTGDHANAILVKETRQSLKSRQFVITFLLLLAAAWLVSMFFMLEAAETIETNPIGGRFFYAFFFVLLVAIFVVVPFTAYRSLLAEREQNTYDVLSITTLSPGQIVRGKLLSSLVQMFLFYSAITPFIAFASLLQGFDLPQVAFVLVLAMFISLGYSMFALLLATLATQRHWQVIFSLFLLGSLAWSLFGFYYMVRAAAEFDGFSSAFREPGFWWMMACVSVAWLSYFVLFYQLAVARLTFEADNRSTGIRLTCSAQFWLLWGMVWLVLDWTTPIRGFVALDDILMIASLISGLHWLIVGGIAATEGPRLSRRTRRKLPRNGFLRLLLVPLLPGGDRGLLYTLLHAGALVGVVAIFPRLLPAAAAPTPGMAPGSMFAGIATGTAVLHAAVVAAYLVIFVGIAALIGLWGGRFWPQFRPAHARLLALLVFLGGTLFPPIVRLFTRNFDSGYRLIDLTNPVTTLFAIQDGRWIPDAGLIVLLIVAGVVLLLNLPHLRRGVAEVFEEPPSAGVSATPRT